MLGLVLATIALVQVPGQVPGQAPAAEAPVVQGPSGAQPAPEAAAPEAAPAEGSPAPTTEAPALAQPDPVPEPTPPDTGLLAPSEDAGPARQVRTTPAQNPGEVGISKDEAMRRYYAKLYRPADNPLRPNFAVHGGLAALGSSQGELNGRAAMLDVEGGISWNKFSLGLGAGVHGGNIRLDSAGDVVSTVGVSGLANVGIGRLGFSKKSIVDLRLGYRLTYMPLRAGTAEADEPEQAYMIPHGPELRFDAAFMVSKAMEPRLFNAVGISLSLQLVPNTIGIDIPFFAVPRFGLVYSFS